MLIGEYTNSVDKKGRVTMPAKFVKEMGKTLFISRGLDGTLSVYTKKSWQKLEEKINQLSMTKEKNRAFARFILSGSQEISPDSQGRILIPQHLREHADIDSKLVWTGLGDKAEIWSEKKWDKYLKESVKNPEEIAESLEDII